MYNMANLDQLELKAKVRAIAFQTIQCPAHPASKCQPYVEDTVPPYTTHLVAQSKCSQNFSPPVSINKQNDCLASSQEKDAPALRGLKFEQRSISKNLQRISLSLLNLSKTFKTEDRKSTNTEQNVYNIFRFYDTIGTASQEKINGFVQSCSSS